MRRVARTDYPAVRRSLNAALKHAEEVVGCPSALEVENCFDFDSAAKNVWVLWREESPVALFHVNPTSRLGGGFEAVTWVSVAVPPDSAQVQLILDQRLVVRFSVPEFCQHYGFQWGTTTRQMKSPVAV